MGELVVHANEVLYDSILADYEVGDYGEATLDEGENRLTVRNRLKAAAGRKSVGINFRRTTGDLLRFQVVEPGDVKVVTRVQRAPEPEPVAPPKKKGGRPKKKSAA
jgi:hypothetical protein